MAMSTTPIKAVLAKAASSRAVLVVKAEGRGTFRNSTHHRRKPGIEYKTRRKGDETASTRNVTSRETPSAG
jgi:hypothetical protein